MTRFRRERGAGLLWGVLFMLLAATLANGIAARCALHLRAVHRSTQKLEALALAEAGAELIAHARAARLAQPFGRGRFEAGSRKDESQIIIVSRGIVPSSLGGETVAVVQWRGRYAANRFERESWETIPDSEARR